jgi:putative ABC transport system ATP-binding protein
VTTSSRAVSAFRLGKTFGPRTAFSDLSFTLAPGETLAITGPSGSGKSTALHCLGLLERPAEGTINLLGEQVWPPAPRGRRPSAVAWYRDRIGFLFQNYALVEDRSVEYNVLLGRPRGLLRGVSKATRTAAAEALAVVGLGDRGQDPVYELSGGEQQRVALARLLLKDPRIVLADEPTGALDEGNRDLVLDLMETLAARGAAIVVVTHDRAVADRASQEIVLASDCSHAYAR